MSSTNLHPISHIPKAALDMISPCCVAMKFVRHFGLVMLATFFVLSNHTVTAAPGALDSSFGRGGRVTSDFQGSNDFAYAVALQPDGKIVTAGIRFVGIAAEGGDFLITRYNPDGTLDRRFGQRGHVITDFGLTELAAAIAVQPDGKIIAAGGTYDIFPFLGGQFALARYNSNGSLDPTFGIGGLVRTTFNSEGCFASAIVLQADGKIIVAGTKYIHVTSDQSSDTDFGLARYNSDGSLDSTFGVGGEVATDFNGGNDDALSVLLQPDGRIVAVGDATSIANFYDFALTRYLPDGTIDTTFGNLGKVESDFGAANLDQARSAVLQSDGKIVAAGTTVTRNGLDQLFAVVRYNSDGSQDAAFGNGGLATVDFGSFLQSARSVLIQSDGKLIAVGYPDTESSDSDFLTARLNTDGTLDSSFGVGGKVRTSFGNLNGGANAAVLQPDGKIVAVGFNATPTRRGVDLAMARYLGN
ncbi:MAG: delta-60 repeat domain-containing protein [Chthoniobacterales bacterium]